MLRGAREGGPMFKDSRGIGGGIREERGGKRGGSEELKEHGENSHTQQEVNDSFAHTGDRTGPTQPHGEFRRGETLSPEGGLELHAGIDWGGEESGVRAE